MEENPMPTDCIYNKPPANGPKILAIPRRHCLNLKIFARLSNEYISAQWLTQLVKLRPHTLNCAAIIKVHILSKATQRGAQNKMIMPIMKTGLTNFIRKFPINRC